MELINLFENIINVVNEISKSNYMNLLNQCREKIIQYKNNGGNKEKVYKKLFELYKIYDKSNEEEKINFIADILDIITGWLCREKY
jgi:hypothetical protein